MDVGNGRVQEFSSSGAYLSQFGSPGTGNGQFFASQYGYSSIAIDAIGDIWVTDCGNNRVEEFSSTGTYLSRFGTQGSGNGQLSYPTDIDVNGNIWITDTLNGRVVEFGPDGTYLSKFGSFGTGNGHFNTPLGIAIDFIGNIWVTDWANHNIQEFSATGTYLATFGSYGIGSGQYLNPMGIAVIPAPLPPPPVGTVLWTNSGDGSGFASIVPAVPASTGVADIFGFQNDGTVAAITSAGNTAWTTNVGQSATLVPDFQGGLVIANFAANGVGGSITKLDGITGQPYPAYNFASGQFGLPVVHTDGTIFAIQSNSDGSSAVIGIDPTTGTQKFSVPMNPTWASSNCPPGGNFAGVGMYGSAFKLMIAGDGNAYVAYFYAECGTSCDG